MNIGTKVKYSKGYHLKCGSRFNSYYEDEEGKFLTRHSDAIPSYKEGIGFIIGERSVIMSNYKLHRASYHPSSPFGPEESDQAFSTGKKETVYLVVKNSRTKAFYVRKTDILEVL